MNKRKICVVTSNRADYTKLVPVMKSLIKNPNIELSLVVTGSHLLKNYGETKKYIENDGFKIDFVARTILEGEDLISMTKSIGIAALEMPTILDQIKPDLVLIVGDRFEILPVAIASAFMNIPLAHIQGGEVSGTIDETTRHTITKLAHIHFPATEKSKERIIKLGEKPEHIFNLGCPGVDVIKEINYKPREKLAETKEEYTIDINPNLPYIILIQHPVTTEFEQASEQILTTLKAVSRTKMQTVMFYPNIDAGNADMIKTIRNAISTLDLSKVYMYKHMSYFDFLNLLKNAECIVGNSSAGIRESCLFGTPTVNIGTRQNGRERTENIVDVDCNEEQIYQAILDAVKHGKYPESDLYGDGESGKKIAEVLANIDISNIVQKKLTY
jgi:UDP-hydrolysing UDP-N-acetyl-D-glucosamine 2-epimerase